MTKSEKKYWEAYKKKWQQNERRVPWERPEGHQKALAEGLSVAGAPVGGERISLGAGGCGLVYA